MRYITLTRDKLWFKYNSINVYKYMYLLSNVALDIKAHTSDNPLIFKIFSLQIGRHLQLLFTFVCACANRSRDYGETISFPSFNPITAHVVCWQM